MSVCWSGPCSGMVAETKPDSAGALPSNIPGNSVRATFAAAATVTTAPALGGRLSKWVPSASSRAIESLEIAVVPSSSPPGWMSIPGVRVATWSVKVGPGRAVIDEPVPKPVGVSVGVPRVSHPTPTARAATAVTAAITPIRSTQWRRTLILCESKSSGLPLVGQVVEKIHGGTWTTPTRSGSVRHAGIRPIGRLSHTSARM